MRTSLARLEALEQQVPCNKLLIVIEVRQPDGVRYRLPNGQLLPLHEVYNYMRTHGQGVLLIDDLPEMPQEGGVTD